MREKLKGKIDDIKENVEKLEKENKKLTSRISVKKDEYEDKCKRVKQLMDEIEKTRRNILMANQELDSKHQDRENIRKYLKQFNNNKK